MNIYDAIRFHHNRGCPILAVTSPDPISLVDNLQAPFAAQPVLIWDCVLGFQLGRENESSQPSHASLSAWEGLGKMIGAMPEGLRKATLQSAYNSNGKGDLAVALDLATELPRGAIIVIKHATEIITGPRAVAVQQAIMNLRTPFSATGRLLVLVASNFELPACLRNDVVMIDELLPNRDDCISYLDDIASAASVILQVEDRPAVIDAIAGLSKFQAYQALSLAIQPNGYDLQQLWALKKQLVDQHPGLSIHFQSEGFESLGGLGGIKDYFRRLMNGRKPPQIIVWLDEIEKSGLNHTGDSNGINADLLGTMLSYMEDHNVWGTTLVGVPGQGKSAIVKAAGAEFNRLVLRLDLGAIKGRFVGVSEANLRAALRLISALGQDNVVFVATSNSIRGLDAALRSRFVDTFYFGLPTAQELAPIWEIHKRRYAIEDPTPSTLGWVGRNVKQCVEKAYRFRMSLAEATEYIVPVGVSAADDIARLNEEASGRYLCASTGRLF